MGHLRLTFGLVASMGAFAFAASPALAHEFSASASGTTHGTAGSEQAFKFGPFKITCDKVTTKNTVTAGMSGTYATTVKYAKCLTSAKVGAKPIFLPTRFLTPLEIEYSAEGGAVILGTVEIKVYTGRTDEFAKSECHLRVNSQTIPAVVKQKTTVTYTNAVQPHATSKAFPSGEQHYIVISNEFNDIKFELEGEPCEEWGRQGGPEAGGGAYTGSFPQFLSGGNLEFL